MGSDDTFAARWSRRKQAARKPEQEPVQAESPADVVPEEPIKSEAEILAELNLKNPDNLVAGDDFSGFMKETVPHFLRTKALRKLWSTNPVLANLDQLLDYGDDFTGKGDVVEKVVTAYKVGKGYSDQIAKADDDTPEEETLEEEASVDEDPAIDETVEAPVITKATEVPVQASEQEIPALEPPEDTHVATGRRRMIFRF